MMNIVKQWTKFSSNFSAGSGEYKISCKVFIPDAIMLVGWHKTIMIANKYEIFHLEKIEGYRSIENVYFHSLFFCAVQ